MRRKEVLAIASLVCLLWGATAPGSTAANDALLVESASSVLREFMALPASQIPTSLLKNAKGVVIIPKVVKGGFVVGVHHGRGVLMTRDSFNNWQVPVFASFSGGGVGWQAGIQSTDLILVLNTEASVRRVYEGKLTIGVDAAAAAGPVGRKANASTDATLQAEILSYSRSRGLFVGLSVDGSSLQVDTQSTRAYYQIRDLGPLLPLSPTAQVPNSASRLVAELTKYSEGGDEPMESPTVGAPVNLAPMPPSTVAAPDALRMQLDASADRLFGLVDPAWRNYLAIPKDMGAGTVEAVGTCLKRYDSIASDAKYMALQQRPEFTATHRLLRDYYNQLVARGSSLNLPPPPPR